MMMSKQIFTWCKSITQATSRLGLGLQLVTVVLPDWKHIWLSIPENILGWFSHLGRVVRLTSQAVCGGNTTLLRILHCLIAKIFLKSNEQLLDTYLWFHQCVEWHNALCAPKGASLQHSEWKQIELFVCVLYEKKLISFESKISNCL